MAIKSSSQGAISFSEIKAEFGDSNGKDPGVSLGKYRVSQRYGELTLPLDEGIPSSGQIAMSQFYSKKLNIVVNYYNWPNGGPFGATSANTEAASGGVRVSRATGRYKQNNGSECVGEFKNPPVRSNNTPKTEGSKVWLHVNKTLGGAGHPQNSEKYCTFRTGEWPAGTDLRIHLGNEGKIYGRGGEGGVGGDGKSDPGESGSRGTSAIGVEYTGGTTIITSAPGAIAAGGGGGGGGGGAGRQEDRGNDRSAGGGGGGGGAGLPGGSPGTGGNDGDGRFVKGDGGEPGSTTAGGKEGDGGDNAGEAKGGDGGEGGNLGQSGESGRRGSGDDGTGDGGEGGSGGEWLRTEGNTVQYGGFQGQTFGGPVSGDVA
jgi:hypothetical protein